MTYKKLKKGDTIGIICPSHIGSKERYEKNISTIESFGLKVKMGKSVYNDTYGYLASEKERADDFNAMAADNEVKMILFGGGEGGNELLPLLDYAAIKANPKFICSFSDGTTILNAIHSATGLTTYYGQGPGMFYDLRYYDFKQFSSHFIDELENEFEANSPWYTAYPGECTGKLIGGYTRNFALLTGSKYFSYEQHKKYILFLEDHEKFSRIAEVSSYISHIEQSGFIENVAGLIFGHYSENPPHDLIRRLERFGTKHNVPVVYTDDFGHGVNHAIFPIGNAGRLDATNKKLFFL